MSLNELLGSPENKPWANLGVNSIQLPSGSGATGTQLNVYEVRTVMFTGSALMAPTYPSAYTGTMVLLGKECTLQLPQMLAPSTGASPLLLTLPPSYMMPAKLPFSHPLVISDNGNVAAGRLVVQAGQMLVQPSYANSVSSAGSTGACFTGTNSALSGTPYASCVKWLVA